MKQIQAQTDGLAVSLSVLCTLHCLLVPIMVIAIPTMSSFFFVDDAFHIWMVVAVIPVSALALYSGWKKHLVFQVVLVGSIGLLVISCAAFLGHEYLSEYWERFLTVIGTILIIFSHIWNYYLWKVETSETKKDNKDLIL
jgi:hypothetical protein